MKRILVIFCALSFVGCSAFKRRSEKAEKSAPPAAQTTTENQVAPKSEIPETKSAEAVSETPKAQPVPQAEAPEQTASTPFDKESVRTAIRSRLKAYQACYETLLEKKPEVEGKVFLQWIIDENGRVIDASFRTDVTDLKDSVFGTCMLGVLNGTEFSKAPKNNVVEINYPFYFSK